jgi:hypothetical protein
MTSRNTIMDEESEANTKKTLKFINNKLKDFLEILVSEIPPRREAINPYMQKQLEEVGQGVLEELTPLINSLDTRATYDEELLKLRRKYLKYREKIVSAWDLIRLRTRQARMRAL